MAGGMRRRTSPSLAERVAESPTVSPSGPRPAPPGTPALRHCWVDGPCGRQPGLLLTWRQGPGGWQGRVVHPVEETAGWVVVEEWLPATLLSAADGDGR